MRLILGVLRQPNEPAERAPRPGVDQVYTLIQRSRARGQQIELNVDGDPGTLTAGLDLAIYRILEDALRCVGPEIAAAVKVSLSCSDPELALSITTPSAAARDWPTDTMRERVALCGGELSTEIGPRPELDAHCSPAARYPRSTRMTVRVLIADDQRLIRAGFRMILSTQPDIEVVGEAATAPRRSSSPASCIRTSS